MSTATPFATHRDDTAEYIGRLAGELALMAREADLPLLSYLLQMAQLEARRDVVGGIMSGSRRRSSQSRLPG